MWAKLNDVYWRTQAFIISIKTYPDLSRMTDPQLNEFLESSVLAKWEQDELKGERDRNAYYIKHVYWHRLVEIRDLAADAHIHIQRYGIFLPSSLKGKFMDVSDLVWEALMENQSNEEYDIRPKNTTKQDDLKEKGPNLINELEAEVHQRIWGSQDTSNLINELEAEVHQRIWGSQDTSKQLP
ncbi:MAG: hypothetical protein HP496_09020 [Nitrospira sp.]|nr:hypothetical protein [Nitrospira sp.]